ncbi:MAG: GAF domain-containing protein [Deltaproteobacteria bacterium]|nr:MAG: GAF domain-containing protein [Deltaproteobacteria bacterium]
MKYQPHALLDMRFSDFTARHIFSAKLRLAIIATFWFVIVTFYPELLLMDPPIALLVSLTFVVTTICYIFILRGRWPVFFFVLELAADAAAQTVIVHLTGGPISNYFTIYIIYACSGGLFYNYRVASVMAGLSLFFYTLLIVLISYQWIEPFTYVAPTAGIFYEMGVFRNLIMLAVALVVGIYGIWVSNHFTLLRERALEEKNRELTALNKISSVTRSVLTLERVIHELLKSVRFGMRYEDAFLLIKNEENQKMQFHFNHETAVGSAFSGLWKESAEVFLPLENQNNRVYQSMLEKKLIIRNQLVEILRSFSPQVSEEDINEIQKVFGFRKFLAAPLVAEGKVLGALIGVSREVWITQEAVRAFEGFADQAALMIDNMLLLNELKKKNVELERVSRVKSEFLATMSHELRTPLTAIIGFSELLAEEVMGTLSKEQKESLREIHENGENLLYMINGLLDLAKIESGKMDVSVGPFYVPELVDRVQRMISSLIQKKKHHVVSNIHKDFPIFYADERKVQQVLLNLFSNAIKFTLPERDCS